MSAYSRRDALKLGAALALTPALGSGELCRQATAQEPAVATPGPYDDAVLVDGEPAALADGSFTIAVLPDTQNYSEKFPKLYLAQTDWIVKNRQPRNIACVLHLGDITQTNTAVEWKVAARAMKQLDGHVPYFMTLGNHDYSANGKCVDRTTHFNTYFPLAKYRTAPTFGGVYDREPDRLENSFHTFAVGDRKFLVLSLEFGPRADVLRWANQVVADHRDREAILITHAYMFHNDTRYDWNKYGKQQNWNPHAYGVAAATSDDVNDGEELWQKLVSKHENFILTLNGHVLVDGLGRTVTPTPGGRDVHQVLVNFQMRPVGGDGWLRLLEFRADRKTVEVVDYSPTRNQHNNSPQNRFTMQIAPVAHA